MSEAYYCLLYQALGQSVECGHNVHRRRQGEGGGGANVPKKMKSGSITPTNFLYLTLNLLHALNMNVIKNAQVITEQV